MKNTRRISVAFLFIFICLLMVFCASCSRTRTSENNTTKTGDKVSERSLKNDKASGITTKEDKDKDKNKKTDSPENSENTENPSSDNTSNENSPRTENGSDNDNSNDSNNTKPTKKSDGKKSPSKSKEKKTKNPNAGKKWVEPVYKEVHHDEEGHYETQNTGRIKCCGRRSGRDGCDVYFDSMSAYKSHQEAYVEKKRIELNDPNYVCTGDHSPAKYETEEVWVVDKAAWTEKVLVKEGHWE